MAAVLQDNVLFDSSIRENIRMGRPDATDAEIETAARAAEVHDSIVAKPQGYDTPVGERGGRLSGGERQRVAIARALIRDPAVLILDEASAALDPTTEASLNATLARLAAGRTVVSVTHRLASITHVDQIFVLQAGRVVQHGTHEQLLGEAGLYKQLWDKQSGFVLGDGLSAARVEPHRLRAIPMLAELEDHVLEELAQLLMPVSLPADRVVVQEGDPADTFYMIARGRVAVKRGETVLNILEDGDYFGEVALLGGGVRTATVTTLAASTFLACTRGAFDRLLLQSTRLDQEVRQRASMRRSR
jgi:ATP-binding cassette subfamily B protein